MVACSRPNCTDLRYAARLWVIVSVAQIVVKYGGQGQSGQAIKLFQAPQKLVLTSNFDTSLSFLML